MPTPPPLGGRVDATPIVAQLRRWARTYSAQQIAAFTGVDPSYVIRIVNGATPAFMRRATAQAVLDADPTRLVRTRSVPVELLRQRVYSLAAAGYPITWQSRQVGYVGNRLTDLPRRRAAVHWATFHRFDDLYQQIGVQPASSRDGITQLQIGRAKRAAARHGYLTPEYYDDYGHLIADQDEGAAERAGERERTAVTMMETLRLSLADRSIRDISDLLSIDKRQVSRWRSEAGLQFEPDPLFGGLQVQQQCRNRAREIRSALLEWEGSTQTALETAQRLGLLHRGGKRREPTPLRAAVA